MFPIHKTLLRLSSITFRQFLALALYGALLITLTSLYFIKLPGHSPSSTNQITLPITADNSIVDYIGEQNINMGAASSIRIKGNEHHLILKVDTVGLVGKKVTGATLRYHRHNETLEHVTISSIQGDWVEGNSSGFNVEEGASCYLGAAYSSQAASMVPWSFKGSRFVDVVFGNGYSLLGTSDSPVVDGFYEWNVPPDVVNAIDVGAAYGIAVIESSGRTQRNPTVHATGGFFWQKPTLVVKVDDGDFAPTPISKLKAGTSGVDRGELRLSWIVPTGAFAYEVKISGGAFDEKTAIPRYLIPFAAQAGTQQEMLLRDILEPGVNYQFSITAIARGGARAKAATIEARASEIEDYPDVIRQVTDPISSGSGITKSGLELWAMPVTNKVDPKGNIVDIVPNDYKTRNPVFDGASVRLRGLRNDLLSFLLIIADTGKFQRGITIDGMIDSFSMRHDRVSFIDSEKGLVSELLRGPAKSYATNMDEQAGARGQHAQAILIEIPIPSDTTHGKKVGSIKVKWQGNEIVLPVVIQVEDLIIPDKPAFNIEMNDYGYPKYLKTFEALQKMAHRFRSHVNLVPYRQEGITRMNLYFSDGSMMDGAKYNDISAGATTAYWTDFEKGFAPFFDDTFYEDMLWAGVPLPGFYLTFHESWPLLAKNHYKTGVKDVYDAFPVVYGETFKALLADFASLATKRSWKNAGFQVYLNNKPNKADARFTIDKGSTPWVLDEPVSFWDFRALGYYGRLFRDTIKKNTPLNLKFRIDISRYRYHRGQLDGVVDLAVVNRELFTSRRLIFDLAERDGIEVWNYGTPHQVWQSNLNGTGWVLGCYAIGCEGILPWSTVKYGSQYLKGVTGGDSQKLALFIVAEDDAQATKVYGSLRLAAYRRGALDVDYLELLRKRGGYTRGQIERLIRHYLDLDAAFSVSSSYAESAGAPKFDKLDAIQLWRLRTHVLNTLIGLQDVPPTEGPLGGSIGNE